MLMKLFFYILLGTLGSTYSEKLKSIQGRWINVDDKHSIITIDQKYFCQIYKKDTVYIGKYTRECKSCDTSYFSGKSSVTLDFLKLEDGSCYEITSILDTTLALRHTESGKIQVLKREPRQR